jgi:hypothetical protein
VSWQVGELFFVVYSYGGIYFIHNRNHIHLKTFLFRFEDAEIPGIDDMTKMVSYVKPELFKMLVI